jgi:transposase
MTKSIRKITKMIEYHLQGLSVRDIAKKVRVSKTTVQTYITKYRNNELLQLNLFSEENLKKKIYAPVSSQSRQKFYRPQEHYTYHINQEPKQVEQYYLENNQEYKLRERENQKDEQARKSDQEFREKLHQLEMKFYSMRQETERQKQQKISDFLQKLNQDKLKFKNEQSKKAAESYKKIKVRVQNLEKENLINERQKQKLIESIPTLVQESMKKKEDLRKASEEKTQMEEQHLENVSIQEKQVNLETSREADYSGLLLGLTLGGIQTVCKVIRFHFSQNSNVSINSTEYWRKFSKYLQSR